jgi:antitoxin component YwqK of YwqJK toxin-antitoxin module
MKRYFLLLILLFLPITEYAQTLTISELFALCNKQNWDDVNEYILKKGWEYNESSKGDDSHYNTITWSFNKELYEDKARGWFYLYTYEGFPNKIVFTFFNLQTYNILKTGITTLGLKIIDNSIEDNKILTKYSGSGFIVTLTTQKRTVEENPYNTNTFTSYTVSVVKKAGIYDDDNGLKRHYNEDGILDYELLLKDGNLNGTSKTYYPNGQVKIETYFINGVKQGVSHEYSENGKLTGEYFYINDKTNGPYKIYDNGYLKMTGSLVNGEKNGKFKEYDKEGHIIKEYYMKLGLLEGEFSSIIYDEGKPILRFTDNYIDDKKSGVCKTIKLNEDGEEILEYSNFINGIENGPFKIIHKDSIILGSYKNGDLDGEYKVYINLKSLFVGGIYGDTSSSALIIDGNYSYGKKVDQWNFYSLSKLLIIQGQYFNGLQTGEWKYYFQKYTDNKNNPLPYSGKLYLIENYLNGKKNGKETQYASLDLKDVPCDTTVNKNVNPLDTCHIFDYKNFLMTSYYKDGELNGPFEYKDSLSIIRIKGNYINGKREGQWITGYWEKNNNENYFIYNRGNYINGKKTGIWEEYLKDDLILVKYNYDNDELNGKTTEFTSQGIRYIEKYFDKGKLKIFLRYDSLGLSPERKYEIISETKFDLKCRRTDYNNNGKISQVYWMKKPVEFLNHNTFEWTFLIYTNSKYTKDSTGYPDGEYIEYNHDDKIVVEGKKFKKNLIGKWIYNYYINNILLEEEYNNNILSSEKYFVLTTGKLFSGKFIIKFDNGKMRFEFNVSNGLRDGKSKYFNEEGKLIKTENYKKGKINK